MTSMAVDMFCSTVNLYLTCFYLLKPTMEIRDTSWDTLAKKQGKNRGHI